MNYADRVKETTTVTSTSTITLLGLVSPYRTFTSAFANGTTSIPICVSDAAGNFENGLYTLTNSNTLTRTALLGSSNNGLAVTFPAGVKDVYCTVPAVILAKMTMSDTVDFTTVIPLNVAGRFYMPTQTISSAQTFTAAANPVRDALVYVSATANGNAAHIPNLTAFKQWGGSSDWDNRNGIVNQLQFFCDGTNVFYSVSQHAGQVPIETVAPTAASAAVANATPSTVAVTMSEAMDPTYTPAASAFTVSGHTVLSVNISGSVISLSVSPAFANAEAARTVAYTQPGTNNARDLAGNLLANFTGLAITNNVQAVDTTAPAFSSAQVANATPTIIQVTMNETLANSVPPASAFTASGKTVTGVSVAGTLVSVTVNSAYISTDTITISYTQPGSNPRLQDSTGNPTVTFGPSPVTNNVAVVDGTAPELSSPTATKTGSSTATGTVTTANDANGTLYYLPSVNSTETATAVKAAFSQAVSATGVQNVSVFSLLASTLYYLHYLHRDAAGNDSAVATSNSFTTDAAAPALTATRFSSMSAITESATEPWVYTGTGPSISTTPSGGIAQLALQSGVDGWLEVTVQETSGKPALGINTTGSLQAYTVMPYFFYVDTAKYTVFTTGVNQTASLLNTVVPADNDIIRLRRTGSTLVAEVSKDNRDTWTPIYQWTGVSTGVLRFQGMCPGAANLSILKSPMGSGLA